MGETQAEAVGSASKSLYAQSDELRYRSRLSGPQDPSGAVYVPSINLLLLTARALSRLHLASGCPRFSAPGITLKPEASRPTDQITRICSDTRQLCRTKSSWARSQAIYRSSSQRNSTGHQSQDCQGARLHHAALAARPRRRGDRIETLFAAVHRSLMAHSGQFSSARLCRLLGVRADIGRFWSAHSSVSNDPTRTTTGLPPPLPVC